MMVPATPPANDGPFVFDGATEAKRHAPATLRNRDAIADVLRGALPKCGLILEIASGTGEHICHFATAFPHLQWQPSDPEPAAIASIMAWCADAALSNIAPPVACDAAAPDWPIAACDAILCINMVHIAPWAATQGLMAGAGRLLPPGGLLYLYGPFVEADVETAPGNVEFDASLKSRNNAWGLRDTADVMAVAADAGLRFEARVAMPANNLSLLFRQT